MSSDGNFDIDNPATMVFIHYCSENRLGATSLWPVELRSNLSQTTTVSAHDIESVASHQQRRIKLAA